MEWASERYHDPCDKFRAEYPNDAEKLTEARHGIYRKGRDNARTPIPWTSTPSGGFTSPSMKPWLRLNDDYQTVNVAAQTSFGGSKAGDLSVWQFWQMVLKMRKQNAKVWVYG